MINYAEKRSYPRMTLECPAQFRLEDSSHIDGAIVKNLSSGGVLLWVQKEVQPKSQLAIVISPENEITPPLHARLKVIRSFPLDDHEGNYAAACSILEMLDSQAVGASFP